MAVIADTEVKVTLTKSVKYGGGRLLAVIRNGKRLEGRLAESYIAKLLRRIHGYKNKNIEIRRNSTDEWRTTRDRLEPKHSKFAWARDWGKRLGRIKKAARQRQKDARIIERSKKTSVDAEVKAVLARASDLQKRLKARGYDKYSELSDATKIELGKVSEKYAKQQQQIAKTARVHSGAKSIIVEHGKQISRSPEPKFRAFTAEGQLGLQMQRRNGWVAVDHERENTLCFRVSGDPVSSRRAIYRIRISSRRGKPVWAEVSIVEHRRVSDVPKLGGPWGVVWAYLNRYRLGNKMHYSLRLQINCKAVVPTHKIDASNWVAVRPGYSRQNGGVRAAVAIGSDGQTYEQTFDAMAVANRHAERERLQSELSKAIERCKSEYTPPDGMAKGYGRWSAVRRFARLRSLLIRSGQYDEARQYLAPIMRLHHRIARTQARQVNIRVDAYRCFAAELAAKYDVVILPDSSYTALSRESADNPYRDPAIANSQKAICAPGEMREILRQAFPMRSLEIPYSASTCSSCGSDIAIKDGDAICAGDCSTKPFDRNALMNLAASGEVLLKERGVLAIVEKTIEKQREKEELQSKKTEALRKKKAQQKAAREEENLNKINKGKQ